MSTIGIAAAAMASAVTFAASPNGDLSRPEELYQRTAYGPAIEALQALDGKGAAGYALLGKAYFMQGQYRLAAANLERAVAEDSLNSEYCDWLGRAYGRIAETSSFISALGYAKKTVRAFERAVELGPSNLEALSDVFEYYLEAPGMVGGGVDKAESIAKRIAALDEAEHHWACARLAEKRKDFAAAEREYRTAMAKAPNDVGRLLDVAAFLSSRGRFGESDALFRTAEERYPGAAKVLFARAAAYVRGKRNLEEARELLHRYLNSHTTPDDPSRLEATALLKAAGCPPGRIRQAD